MSRQLIGMVLVVVAVAACDTVPEAPATTLAVTESPPERASTAEVPAVADSGPCLASSNDSDAGLSAVSVAVTAGSGQRAAGFVSGTVSQCPGGDPRSVVMDGVYPSPTALPRIVFAQPGEPLHVEASGFWSAAEAKLWWEHYDPERPDPPISIEPIGHQAWTVLAPRQSGDYALHVRIDWPTGGAVYAGLVRVGGTPMEAIEGVWALDSFTSDGVDSAIKVGVNTFRQPWIEINAGSLREHAGCNDIGLGNGSLSFVDGLLIIDSLSKTEILCVADGNQDPMITENIITSMIISSSREPISVFVSDTEMVWVADNGVLNFVPTDPPEA